MPRLDLTDEEELQLVQVIKLAAESPNYQKVDWSVMDNVINKLEKNHE